MSDLAYAAMAKKIASARRILTDFWAGPSVRLDDPTVAMRMHVALVELEYVLGKGRRA